ncbi:hypothetical protein ACIQUS_25580 [Pseudomonas sp. NPDC090755]|uniref:hypothetical protein n=1 Tax=Pseudomonas sp. NPDC090755 TaxID=3364481 RepID=UPI00383A2C5C
MANSASVGAYLHIEGFDQFHQDLFDRREIKKGMRRAGKLVAQRAQLNIALARGQGDYPVNRTGTTLQSIKFKVSRAGFLVKVAPYKTSAMKEYYPAYLHYGVKQGRRLQPLAPGKGRGKSNRRAKGQRAAALAERAAGAWRITPRANYMEDALQDSKGRVEAILRSAFAAAIS